MENQFDGEPVVFCSISDGHMAAVTRDGSVWSWGRATFGRLGHEYAGVIVFTIESLSPAFLRRSPSMVFIS